MLANHLWQTAFLAGTRAAGCKIPQIPQATRNRKQKQHHKYRKQKQQYNIPYTSHSIYLFISIEIPKINQFQIQLIFPISIFFIFLIEQLFHSTWGMEFRLLCFSTFLYKLIVTKLVIIYQAHLASPETDYVNDCCDLINQMSKIFR